MAAMAARTHVKPHLRIQALGLSPQEYAALAARAHHGMRASDWLWRGSIVLIAVATVAVILRAMGTPLWLGAILTLVAFVAPLRWRRTETRNTVVVERHHARAA